MIPIESAIEQYRERLLALFKELNLPSDLVPTEASLIRVLVLVQNAEELYLDTSVGFGAANDVRLAQGTEAIENYTWDLVRSILLKAKETVNPSS